MTPDNMDLIQKTLISLHGVRIKGCMPSGDSKTSTTGKFNAAARWQDLRKLILLQSHSLFSHSLSNKTTYYWNPKHK